ncbi:MULTISPECIES: ABC transporter ATP-binding protein [Bifidobacterium]|uniref:UDP-Glucose Exporter (U-GlcE) family protein, ABC transporter n=2 Tax=Bifidobacterium TaxID=1678 RepID=A0A087CK08_9BIFI|nr:ATP-binding cassette domain-containing protein [Bifidobacterium psychraerophilum]KFI83608.1 UDP-Glucose Exporter (U-GlcE) family protein, ABC transporter [Bifidobacterium psychraerophilum]PKA94270.1 putative ABC transport system ATP-binding protein [Bifidobacterium psychraerophilum DSM 22366]
MSYFSAHALSCVFKQDSSQQNGKTLFSNLSLHLERGEIVDLTGPSGSGKSHVLMALALLDPHASAKLTLEGRDSSSFTPESWRRNVVYLPQRPVLTSDTVLDAVLLPFGFSINRNAKGLRPQTAKPVAKQIRNGLDELGLDDVELVRNPAMLSVGQQARVCLLRSLMLQPKVLLSDEVDAGLDPDSSDKVGAMLQNAATHMGMAVLRVRHRNSDGRASRILSLAHGRLSRQEME